MSENNKFLTYEGLKKYTEELQSRIITLSSTDGSTGYTLGNNYVGRKGYYYSLINTNQNIKKIYLTVALDKRPVLVNMAEETGKISTTVGNQQVEYDYAELIDKTFTLPIQTTVNSTVTEKGYARGDKITLVNSAKYEMELTIADFDEDNNAIIYAEDALPFTAINYVDNEDLEPDDYSFSVPLKPDIGACVLKHNGFSAGKNNSANGNEAVAFGRRTAAYGDYALTAGRDNKAGHCSAAFGVNNDVRADYALAIGGDNIIDHNGDKSFVAGDNNYVNGNSNLVTGEDNTTVDDTPADNITPDGGIYGNKNIVGGSYNKVIGDENLVNGGNNKLLSSEKQQKIIKSDRNIVGGTGNELTSTHRNLVVGQNNKIQGESDNNNGANIVGGIGNIIDKKFTTDETDTDKNRYARASLVVGQSNEVRGNDSGQAHHLVGGQGNKVGDVNNIVGGNNNTVTGARDIVAGQKNIVGGKHNIVSGENQNVTGYGNTVNGSNNTAGKNYGLIAGQGNTATRDNQTVLGKFANPSPNAIVSIGDGIDANNKTSVVEVLENGEIILKAPKSKAADAYQAIVQLNHNGSIAIGRDADITQGGQYDYTQTTAEFDGAIAVGAAVQARAQFGAAFGYGTIVNEKGSLVLGTYNKIYDKTGAVIDNQAIAQDKYDKNIDNKQDLSKPEYQRTFVIGNGGQGARSNAVEIFRDGDVIFRADKAAPSTDSALVIGSDTTNVNAFEVKHNGDVIVGGNLTVAGDQKITHLENITVDQNTLTLRHYDGEGEQPELKANEYTGIIASKYNGITDGALVFDASGTAYVGDYVANEEGEYTALQPLATRDLTTGGAVPIWDEDRNTLVESGIRKLNNNGIELYEGNVADEANYAIAGGSDSISDIEGFENLFNTSMEIGAPIAAAKSSISLGAGTITVAEGSGAFGVLNQAGAKAWYWSTMTVDNEAKTSTFTLTKTRINAENPSPEGVAELDWGVGDFVSVINKSRYYFCATIKSINGNMVTLDAIPFTTVDVAYDSFNYTKPDDRTIFACYKSESGKWISRNGIVKIGQLSVTTGGENLTTGACSIANGFGNWAAGTYSAAFGVDNKVSYAGLVAGKENTAGLQSFAFGYRNNSKGSDALAGGRNCIASGTSSIALGESNQAIGTESVALGKRAKAKGVSSFVMCASDVADGSEEEYTLPDGSTIKRIDGSTAEKFGAVCFGESNYVDGKWSTAIGCGNHILGSGVYIMGRYNQAKFNDGAYNSKIWSHRGSIALGEKNLIENSYAVAIGYQLRAGANQTVIGKYNNPNSNYIFAIGNGSVKDNKETRLNAFEVRSDNTAWLNNGAEKIAVINNNTNTLTAPKISTNSLEVGGQTLTGDDIEKLRGTIESADWTSEQTNVLTNLANGGFTANEVTLLKRFLATIAESNN